MYENDIKNLFEPYGRIVSSKLVRDKATKASLGYGFVMYDNKTSAELAIRELNGKNIYGKHLKVAFASKPGNEGSNTNVYIANLGEDTSKESLEALCSTYGKVLETNVIHDRTTGKNRGIAFVKFERRSDAEKAIESLNETTPQGISTKPLVIKVKSTSSQSIVCFILRYFIILLCMYSLRTLRKLLGTAILPRITALVVVTGMGTLRVGATA